MLKAFGYVLAIALVAAGAAWLANNAGEFVVVFRGWRVETSFALVAVLAVLTLLFLAWNYRLLVRTFGGPLALLNYHRTRRQRLGQEALRQGLVAVAAGNPSEVRKLAAKANSLLNDPPLTLLLSAQAAQLEGDEKRAIKAYKKMMDNPETEFLGLRGLFIDAVRKGKQAEALGFVERAFELQPETPWVFNALFELQSAVGEWAGAAQTLEQSVKSKHIAADVAKRKRAVLYTEQALDAERKGEGEEAENWGEKAAGLSPALIPASVLSAKHHIREGNLWKAAEVIEKAWTVEPHPDLAEVYAKARKVPPSDDAILSEADLKKDEKAEARWLKGLADFNKDHIESRLLRASQDIKLGRARAARKVLKGLAENYPTVRVCQLMAELEAAGDGEDAARAAKRWLSKAVSAPRDAHWMCETCGREARVWSSTCNNCGAFDSLSWKAPADLVADLELEPVDLSDDEPEDAPAPAPTVEDVVAEKPDSTALVPLVVDVVAEPVDEAPAPEAKPAETKEAAQPEAKKPTSDDVAKEDKKEVERHPESNPLTQETIRPETDEAAGNDGAGSKEEVLVPPPVDDPGPDAEDPFTDDKGEIRW